MHIGVTLKLNFFEGSKMALFLKNSFYFFTYNECICIQYIVFWISCGIIIAKIRWLQSFANIMAPSAYRLLLILLVLRKVLCMISDAFPRRFRFPSGSVIRITISALWKKGSEMAGGWILLFLHFPPPPPPNSRSDRLKVCVNLIRHNGFMQFLLPLVCHCGWIKSVISKLRKYKWKSSTHRCTL